MARLSSNPQGQLQVEDRYLIALAKQGNPDAYDRLVRRYYGFVRLKASSYFLAGGDADDLIQEGLVGLYKAVRDFRTTASRASATSRSCASRARSSPR
jgi:RNA polymerase sporulation-specific sigma factor